MRHKCDVGQTVAFLTHVIEFDTAEMRRINQAFEDINKENFVL